MLTLKPLTILLACVLAVVAVRYFSPADTHSKNTTSTPILHHHLPVKTSPLPATIPASRYTATWQNNPFHRQAPRPNDTTHDWSKDWNLAGMYLHDNVVHVSLLNIQTGQYKHLTNRPNSDPEFELISAHFNRDPSAASADIAKGQSERTLRYKTP